MIPFSNPRGLPTAAAWVWFAAFMGNPAVSTYAGGTADSPPGLPADSVSNAVSSARRDSVALLDRMVVTGTRTLRSIKDNPASVFVVPRERIEASPANNISDILLYQPGLQVQRSVGMGEGVSTNINLRGVPAATAGSRTLILVDGIPTNAAGTPFLILNEVPLESIERVEVVEGPYSGLYGPNAFGGVVNIITKTPSPGWHGGVSASGWDDFYDVDGECGVSKGRFSLLVNAAARGIDNWTGRDSVDHFWVGRDSASAPVENHDRKTGTENYGYYDRRFFGKLGYALSGRATLSLQARYFDSKLGLGMTEFGHPKLAVSTFGRKFLVGPSFKMNVTPSFDLKVSGYMGGLTGRFQSQRPVTDSSAINVGSVWTSQSNDFDLDAQAILKLGTRNTLTAGFDVLDNVIDFGPHRDPVTGELLPSPDSADNHPDSVNTSMVNGGIYLQDEFHAGRFVGIVGARLDYNSVFGTALSPKFGLVYKQNDRFRLKLSAGRAFRAPSLGELYLPDMPINSSTTLVSNPSLKPEYIWTVDGGPELEIGKLVSVRATGFYNNMNDLITQKVVSKYVQDLLTNALFSHRNIQNAWSAGAVASVELKIPRWGTAFLNYTYTKSENERMRGPLDYIPEHAANAGIFLQKSFGPITVSASLLENYESAREYLDWQVAVGNILNGTQVLPNPEDLSPVYVSIPSYFRTDASIKIEYWKAWLGIDGLNLTNADIMEQEGTFVPKRFIAVRVGMKF
jgi:outer membrane cobalamin receptor